MYVVGERKNPDEPEPTVSKERMAAIRAELKPLIKQDECAMLLLGGHLGEVSVGANDDLRNYT